MLMPTSDTSPLLSYPSRGVTLPCPISQMKTTAEKTGVQGIRIFLMLYRTDGCGKAGQFFGPPFSAIISVPLLYRHRQRMRNSPSIQSEPSFSIPPFIFFFEQPPFYEAGKIAKDVFTFGRPSTTMPSLPSAPYLIRNAKELESKMGEMERGGLKRRD